MISRRRFLEVGGVAGVAAASRPLVAATAPESPYVLDGILGQLPQLGRALAGFLHDLARGIHRRHAARERGAAAAREEVVAELAN